MWNSNIDGCGGATWEESVDFRKHQNTFTCPSYGWLLPLWEALELGCDDLDRKRLKGNCFQTLSHEHSAVIQPSGKGARGLQRPRECAAVSSTSSLCVLCFKCVLSAVEHVFIPHLALIARQWRRRWCFFFTDETLEALVSYRSWRVWWEGQLTSGRVLSQTLAFFFGSHGPTLETSFL